MKTATEATEAVWRERVTAWRASGETAAQFARGRGYSPKTLTWYASRLRQTATPGFVRLVPRPAAATAPTVVLDVDGVQIRVAPGFDAALLGQVVAALRGAAR
jgi:hypothetical protein